MTEKEMITQYIQMPTILDWRNTPYDEVDRRFHELAGIPDTIPFADMLSTVFRGTVPSTKTSKVFDAIEYAQNARYPSSPCRRTDIESRFRYFRNEKFFENMFPTDKPLHGRRFHNKVIFDVSAYEDYTHETHIALLQQIARIWEDTAVSSHLYDVRKDIHTEMDSRNSLTPFVRDHVAFLVVELYSL